MTTPFQTRRVLSEIPERVGTTPTVDDLGDFPIAALIGNNNSLSSSLSSIMQQSPDEMVIRQRGRRRISLTWSPDKYGQSSNSETINYRNSFPFFQQKTPTKINPLISMSTMVLRSSPRKRLLLNDNDCIISPKKNAISNDTFSTPSSQKKSVNHDCPGGSGASSSSQSSVSSSILAPSIKRMRFDDSSKVAQINSSIPLPIMLKGLSQDQLIQIIKNMIQIEPHLEQKIRDDFPLADLSSFEEQLNRLKKNIFKSLPTSRLSHKTDSIAYSRASIHLTDFKRAINTHCRILNESKNWDALIDYINLSWMYVRSTPIWDAHSHNAIRRQCFKILTHHCTSALRNGGINLGQNRLCILQKNIKDMSRDYEDIKTCLKTIVSYLNK